jgi:hypothetical protein
LPYKIIIVLIVYIKVLRCNSGAGAVRKEGFRDSGILELMIGRL